MAFIQTRATKNSTTFRVGYRDHEGKSRWTPSLADATSAIKMKDLIERIGPASALAILEAQTSGGQVLLLRELFAMYLMDVASSATPGTVLEYRRMAARTWLPMLGEYPVEALTRSKLAAWVAWQRGQETERSRKARVRAQKFNTAHPDSSRPVPEPVLYSVKSLRNAHGLLSQVLRFGVDSDEVALDRNVAYRLKLPSDGLSGREMEIFTPDEFERFSAAMDPWYRLFTVFLVTTGVRMGEATALQVRDFDLTSDTPSVSVRRAWKKGENGRYLGAPKSRRANRTIFLGAGIVKRLAPLIAGRDAREFAFTTPAGQAIRVENFYYRQWWDAIGAAGITKHLTPHSLRHTNASWLLMAGVPPQVVQHRLGHESLETTSKRYAHLLIDAQMPAAMVMDQRVASLADLPELGAA